MAGHSKELLKTQPVCDSRTETINHSKHIHEALPFSVSVSLSLDRV